MLATRMRQAAAGAGGAGVITFLGYDAAGDATGGTSSSITLTSPGAGDYIVFMQSNAAGGSISGTPTLDSQNITIHNEFVVGGQNVIAVGTCTGVGTGSITLAWNTTASQNRHHGWIFGITGGNMATPLQTPNNTSDHDLTWASLTSGSFMAHGAFSQSSTVFTGATDLTWTENLLVGSSSSAGYAFSADSNTTTDITGGAVSNSGAQGIEIAVA